MVQWINNNRSVFWMTVAFIVLKFLKTVHIHLVLVDLMEGKLSDKNLNDITLHLV